MIGFDLEKLLKDDKGEWLLEAERTIMNLAQMDGTAAGQAQALVLSRWLQQRNREQAVHPQRNDQDLSEDWVYKAGTIAAIDAVRRLSQEASAIWENMKRQARRPQQ